MNNAVTELQKCKEDPYYFATTYLTVENHEGIKVPYTTKLSRETFNKIFNELHNNK